LRTNNGVLVARRLRKARSDLLREAIEAIDKTILGDSLKFSRQQERHA